MRHRVFSTTILLLVLAAHAAPARAQYGRYTYPAGYGGYGWGGWGGGGGTVQGSIASGMGNFAAGAGAYNVQTAQARSVNAQTAMQWNQYVWESQQQANQRERARQAERQQTTLQAQDQIQQRIRNNPSNADITSGDALNAALDDLNSPQVYVKALQGAKATVPGTTIRDIPFQKASVAITYSMDQLTHGGPPPSLKAPAFEPERAAMRALAQELRKQGENGGELQAGTIQKAQDVLRRARAKVEATYRPNTRERNEAENFIKALYGLLKILQTPDTNVLLAGVEKRPDTTLGDLLAFMKAYNLRFGVAQTARQRAVYNELYPRLAQLRDQVGASGLSASVPPPPPPGPDSRPANFFAGMQFPHLENKPALPQGRGAAPAR
jgi:hypothetical protein